MRNEQYFGKFGSKCFTLAPKWFFCSRSMENKFKKTFWEGTLGYNPHLQRREVVTSLGFRMLGGMVWGSFINVMPLLRRQSSNSLCRPTICDTYFRLLDPRFCNSRLSNSAWCGSTQIMSLAAIVVEGDGRDICSAQPLWLVDAFVRCAEAPQPRSRKWKGQFFSTMIFALCLKILITTTTTTNEKCIRCGKAFISLTG